MLPMLHWFQEWMGRFHTMDEYTNGYNDLKYTSDRDPANLRHLKVLG